MNIFLLLAAEDIGKQLDKTVGRRNWTELRRPGEYLVRAVEQTTPAVVFGAEAATSLAVR